MGEGLKRARKAAKATRPPRMKVTGTIRLPKEEPSGGCSRCGGSGVDPDWRRVATCGSSTQSWTCSACGAVRGRCSTSSAR
jgi:hypothetical protein